MALHCLYRTLLSLTVLTSCFDSCAAADTSDHREFRELKRRDDELLLSDTTALRKRQFGPGPPTIPGFEAFRRDPDDSEQWYTVLATVLNLSETILI